MKCIYAKSYAFRLLNGISITPCSCKIILKDNFDKKERFVLNIDFGYVIILVR